MQKINKKELALAAKMLKLASDEFSNHGCNDVDENAYSGWTLEERKEFAKDFHKWNGDPEETFFHLADWTIMSFLAAKLEQESEN